EFPPQQPFPGAPCRARFCGPAWLTVLALETGMGEAATAAALEWVLANPTLENVPYRPKLVLSAGFCGALDDRFGVGDILLPTEVVDAAGNCWPTTWPGTLPPGEWRPSLHRGRLLTAGSPVLDTAEKRRLGQLHEALAVDLEAATVARFCR